MHLVLTFTDSQTTKMKCGDDNDLGSPAPVSNQLDSAKPPPLSQLEYPLVRFWDRKVWKDISGSMKDTSKVQTKGGSCGGTRSSKGENIMMLYIEDANGTPIDSNTAGGM